MLLAFPTIPTVFLIGWIKRKQKKEELKNIIAAGEGVTT